VIHFGYCSAGNLKFADPIVLDFIADSFPSVTFIMAHMGTGRGGYWENAKMVVSKMITFTSKPHGPPEGDH